MRGGMKEWLTSRPAWVWWTLGLLSVGVVGWLAWSAGKTRGEGEFIGEEDESENQFASPPAPFAPFGGGGPAPPPPLTSFGGGGGGQFGEGGGGGAPAPPAPPEPEAPEPAPEPPALEPPAPPPQPPRSGWTRPMLRRAIMAKRDQIRDWEEKLARDQADTSAAAKARRPVWRRHIAAGRAREQELLKEREALG